MNLNFLPDSVLVSIKRKTSENLKRYADEGLSWFEEYVVKSGLPRPVQSGIEIDEYPELLGKDGKVLDDAEAAKLVYENFRQLKPAQANDERLWAYLCHVEPFYGYVRARWLKSDSEIKERVVIRRFFFESGGIGGMSKNALSRLWWYGYLTHQDGLEDPYMFTRMLLRYQDTPVGFLERNMGKNPNIVKTVSRYIHENATDWDDRSHAIQKLIKNVNTAGGAIVLDALSDSALYDLCERCAP